MRTKTINVDGIKREAVLVAGGQGFKIYTVFGLNGWALALGRKTAFIADKTSSGKAVSDYVNIKYHAIDKHEEIKTRFNELISQESA